MIGNYLYRHPSLMIAIVVSIIAVGVASLLSMPRIEDPVLGQRVGVVTTSYPAADAFQVESEIAVPLEELLQGISGIQQIRTNCQTGSCNLVLELEDNVDDVDKTWTQVRDRMTDASALLPAGTSVPELDIVPLKAFAFIVALNLKHASLNPSELSRLAQSLEQELSSIPGTQKVQLFGAESEYFSVELKPSSAVSANLSCGDVANQIKQAHEIVPAGNIAAESSQIPISSVQRTPATQRLNNTLIAFRDGQETSFVPLSQIANIQSQGDASTSAWVDGQQSVVVAAMVDDNFQVDRWTREAVGQLRQFAKVHEHDLQTKVLFSQAEFINDRMDQLLRNLVLGTLGVLLVVNMLMGWRSMLVVGISLPLTVCLVLGLLNLNQIPIHQMSVTGLIVALGLLIDNAIVMVDDLKTRIQSGLAYETALRHSVSHLFLPLFGSTLTTVLAFLPIALLPGPPGEFVGTIAWSVIFSVTMSLLLSCTLVPALLAKIQPKSLQQKIRTRNFVEKIVKGIYRQTLVIAFRFPIFGLAIGILFPAFGFWFASSLPEQFFPPTDRAQIQIEVELPIRAKKSSTEAEVQALQAILADYSEIDQQAWFVGASAPTFYYNVVPRRRNAPHYAQGWIDLKPGVNLGDLVRTLQEDLNQRATSARVVVRRLEQGPPFDAPIEVRLQGQDLTRLHRLGQELRRIMSETPRVTHTRSDFEDSVPKLALTFDERALEESHWNRADVLRSLYTNLEGAPAGEIRSQNELVPVRVSLDLPQRATTAHLLGLPLLGGKPISNEATVRQASPSQVSTKPDFSQPTLSSVAEWNLEGERGAIVRIDGRRVNEIKAYLETGALPAVALDQFKLQLEESSFQLPTGYELQFGGESEKRAQAVEQLVSNAVLIVSLIALTLVFTLRSWRDATIVASVGGLSLGLGPLILYVSGFPFGFMAIVGSMGLLGLAINDSIVVLANLRQSAAASTTPDSETGDAETVDTETVDIVMGATRHVVATTFTTLLGFLPLIIYGGEFWPPLAITLGAGVGGATLLALYFVPAAHLILSGRRSERVSESA